VQTFSDAMCILIEPRTDVQAGLQSLRQADKRFIVAQVLVGASEGLVTFRNEKDRSSIFPHANGTEVGTPESAKMTTIDRLIEVNQWPRVDFIKLDLQGAELEALRGASHALEMAQFVLLELSLIPFQTSQPVFAEMVAFMQNRGYALYDIWALWHRPLDGALGQGDFLFIREDHPLRRDARWSQEALGRHA